MDRAEFIMETARQLYDAVLEPDFRECGMQPVIDAVNGDSAVLSPRAIAETLGIGLGTAREYSLFDVSGASSIVANYFGGNRDSASRIAVAIPGNPTMSAIPAPAALPLALGGLAILGALGWRQRS